MSRRKVICLVDDDPDEIGRFKQTLGVRFDIGAGQSIEAALGDLTAQKIRRRPDLFLLDLYRPQGDTPLTPPQRQRLHDERRLLLEAQLRFRGILAELGQTRDGGFALARHLKDVKPSPYAFFTRKGTLEDAAEGYDQGAVAVIGKPDPGSSGPTGTPPSENLDADYDAAAKDAAELLASRIERAIKKGSRLHRWLPLLLSFAVGVASGVVSTYLVRSVDAVVTRTQ